MSTCTLIIYEPLTKFKENQSYWKKYIEYYEKYWGGPPSPLGVWFGNEYRVFQKKLSEYLDMDEGEITDCFFTKDQNNNYYIAPSTSARNIFTNKDFIPIEWFFIFSEKERKELHSHWGFNAIHYSTRISDALERLNRASGIIEPVLERGQVEKVDVVLKSNLEMILEGLEHIKKLLLSYDSSGSVVLNYGDICSVIHPYTLRNEKSVKEVSDMVDMLKDREYEKVASSLMIFSEKWDEIRRKSSGEIENRMIQ